MPFSHYTLISIKQHTADQKKWSGWPLPCEGLIQAGRRYISKINIAHVVRRASTEPGSSREQLESRHMIPFQDNKQNNLCE